MKKIVYIVMLLLFPAFVYADGEVNVNKFKEILISGDISNNAKEECKAEGVECTFTLTESGESFSLTINMVNNNPNSDYEKDTIILNFNVDKANNVLYAEYSFDEPENYNFLSKEEQAHIDHYKKFLKLVPLWGLESTSYYKRIKAYRTAGDDYINFLSPIFEKCDLSVRGACFIETTHQKVVTIKGEVKLSSSAAEYAIKFCEERSRNNRQNRIYVYCVIIIVVLGPIFLIKLKQKDREDVQKKNQRLYGNKFFQK